MTQERPAECALEEVVGDHVVRCAGTVQVLVHRQLRRVVMAHRQAGGITAGGVAVLLAAVELVLLLIEAVHDVAGASARQPLRVAVLHPVRRELGGRRARLVRGVHVVVDRERRAGVEVAVERGAARRCAGALDGLQAGMRRVVQPRDRRRGRHEVGVVLRQAVDRRARLVDLRGARLGIGQAVDLLVTYLAPQPVQVVEAVVLLVDHDQMLVVPERAVRRRRTDRVAHQPDSTDDGDGTCRGD